MAFSIDNNVPIPKMTRRTKYPFADLNPGESFFVATKTGEESKRIRARLATAACIFRRTHTPEWKFCTRSEDNGARVWRVW